MHDLQEEEEEEDDDDDDEVEKKEEGLGDVDDVQNGGLKWMEKVYQYRLGERIKYFTLMV